MKTILLSFLVGLPVWAANVKPLLPSAEETRQSISHNRKLRHRTWSSNLGSANPSIARPFSEVEDAGFLLFHSDTYYTAADIKDTLASNLPNGVKLIVYTDQSNEVSNLKNHYGALAGQNNVEILNLQYKASDRAIWARDNTPIPVLLNSPVNGRKWGAVDAVYYGGDEPDLALANWFHIELFKNQYQFEGGNFVADSKGNCLVVNKAATAQIPDSIFLNTYGCKKVLRLRHVAGIGHADERVKFIDEKVVLTDTPSYVSHLSNLGYEVRTLPKPQGGEFRTYVNSLSINDKIFVPVFGEDLDEEALSVYRSTGKQVIPVNSEDLSDNGNGSVHCITMTYPKVELTELKRWLIK